MTKLADMPEIPETVSVQDARRTFADLVSHAQWGGQPVQITKHGKSAAYLVGPEWFKRARQALGED